ncbi:hypothetical protein BDZ89DRAFT_1082544 [Hymenopellis radicata]|nr:hypothetical protein BDZ89DRAFT_1082544 [Hymenopellis radicata]
MTWACISTTRIFYAFFLRYVGRGSAIYSQAVAEHPLIQKVAFTGSTATVRRVQEASSKSNLKATTLALGALISSSMTRTSNKPSSGRLWVSSLTMARRLTYPSESNTSIRKMSRKSVRHLLWLRPRNPILVISELCPTPFEDIPSKR